MGKKRLTSLLLIPVLFLFACQPTDLDGVGVTQEDSKVTPTLELDRTRNIEGYSKYKQLGVLESLGVDTSLGVSLENLRLNGITLEYPIIKEMIDSLNSTSDKSVQDISISDSIRSVHLVGENTKQDLTYSILEDKHIYELTYNKTFDKLEDFEAYKKTFDSFIIESTEDYAMKEVVVESSSLLNPIIYQVYSQGLRHFVVNSTNDSYGRYVLSIRYVVSANIEYYLKSEYTSALKSEGVLSVGTLGQYRKTSVSSRLTEDFIPLLSETLDISLEDYLIEDKGVVQESTFYNDTYEVKVLSENGYVIYAVVSFIGDSLSYNEYRNILNTITTKFNLKSVAKNTYDNYKEITRYSDKKDALIEERVFAKNGVNRLYFMSVKESTNFIEYQLLRELGSEYMNYR